MKNKVINFSYILFLLIVFICFHFLNCQRVDKEIKSQIDIEAKDNQLSYNPEDGSTVKVSPPPFIWVPVKGNFTYTLQIAKDKKFQSGLITKKGIDISTYALEQSLEPGEWFWRYGAEGERIIFSKVRKFIIPSDAKVWYYPGIKQVINSIPKGRPRLFILKDEIESYRQRAKSGDLKKLYTDIVNECKKHIGEKLVPEPPYLPEKDPEFGIVFKEILATTRPAMDLMEKFGVAYILTGEKKYGEEAKRRILHFCGWNPNGSTSDEANDEPAMWILYRGIGAYDWTYDLFTPEERDKVESVLKIRAKQFYDRLRYKPGGEYHSYNYGSHEGRILGFLGETCLCFAHEWKETEDWLDYVLTLFYNTFPAWGKEDGGWHQGPGYWTAYMSFAIHFILPLKKATGIDLMEKKFFHNTPYYMLYTNPPYAKMSPFGDGESSPPGKSRGELMYQFSTLLNDPYIKWYADYMKASPGEDVLGIFLKNDNIKGKSLSGLPQSRYFPGVGLVSLHTNLGDANSDVHFLFHSDPYGGYSHSHPDQNAFTLEAFGEVLAIASGYYPWYGSVHHKNWQWQTKSSNSITVDGGNGQKMSASAKGEIVAFESKDFYDYIFGDATKAYLELLKKFYRYVIHIRPGVFIIYDDLEAPNPVSFEWWLHSLSEMKIDSKNKSILISQGDARLEVLFLQSGELSFNQFKGFPDPPEMGGENDQWHLTASIPSKNTKSRFITLLIPFKKDKEPKISIDNLIEKPDEVSLSLGIQGKKYFISFLPEVVVRQIDM
jgi:hypothetical protein